MSKLFLRKASAVFLFKNGSAPLIISENRIGFRIEKTDDSTVNSAVISIYNLSEKTRDKLLKATGVSLEVGYAPVTEEEVLGQIFVGDINFVSSSKSGTEIITKISCGEGQEAITDTQVSQSFAAGTSTVDVLKYLFKQLKSGKLDDAIFSKVSNSKYQHGVTLSGHIKHFLDAIVHKEGLLWSIQNDKIVLSSPNQIDKKMKEVLSAETGLISVEVGKNKKTQDENSPNTVTFECFINPKIEPTKTVKIESPFIPKKKSFYLVKKCSYTGDTQEGSWTIKGEAILT